MQSFTPALSGGTEAYFVQVLHGAGRVRATAADHPSSASTGGYHPNSVSTNYRGQYTVYDVMGRVVQQSNPTR